MLISVYIHTYIYKYNSPLKLNLNPSLTTYGQVCVHLSSW